MNNTDISISSRKCQIQFETGLMLSNDGLFPEKKLDINLLYFTVGLK